MRDDVTLIVHGHLIGLGSVDGRDTAVGKHAVGEWFSEFSDEYQFEIDEAIVAPGANGSVRRGGCAVGTGWVRE